MGRYITGDIEHKLWYGVQSSDDATFFGIQEYEPNYTTYYADGDNIPEIEKGIAYCKSKLGDTLNKLDKYFNINAGYNDIELAEYLGIDFKINTNYLYNILKWYARLELGTKILECLKREGSCEFQAEH